MTKLVRVSSQQSGARGAPASAPGAGGSGGPKRSTIRFNEAQEPPPSASRASETLDLLVEAGSSAVGKPQSRTCGTEAARLELETPLLASTSGSSPLREALRKVSEAQSGQTTPGGAPRLPVEAPGTMRKTALGEALARTSPQAAGGAACEAQAVDQGTPTPARGTPEASVSPFRGGNAADNAALR
mmetsp:Transcript_35450/g.77592  ORF Transcript_35450/g.77592 Transcript_35450/m.77592 type:complete len:186 (-) Transcript_35450:745-1302(-)